MYNEEIDLMQHFFWDMSDVMRVGRDTKIF